MKKESKKPTFKLWEVIVISVISSLIMSLGTGYIAYRNINNGKQNTSNKKDEIIYWNHPFKVPNSKSN